MGKVQVYRAGGPFIKNERNYYFTGIVGGGYPQYVYYIYISSKLFVNSYTKPLNQSANSPPQYVESSSVSMTNTMSMAVCHCTQDLTYNVHGIFLRVASPFRSVKDVCVAQFSGQMCQIFCREIWRKTSSFRNLGMLASGVPGTISCINWNNCWQFLWVFGMVEIHFAPAKKQKNVRVFGGIMKLQDMGVSENSGFSPQLIHFNRVFHYFHHPFWGFSHDFWKHPSSDPTPEETLKWLPKWRAAQFGSSPFPPLSSKPCGCFHPEISIAKVCCHRNLRRKRYLKTYLK